MAKTKLQLGNVGVVADAAALVMQEAQSYGVRFKVRELLRTLAPHQQAFEEERQRLIAEYAEKDEDGELVLVDGAPQFGDKQAEVDRRWSELRSTEVTVQHKLTLEDVADLPADARLDALELVIG